MRLLLPELETKVVERRKERSDEATTPKVPSKSLLLPRELFRALFPSFLFCPRRLVGGLVLGSHCSNFAGLFINVRQDDGTGGGGPAVDPIVQ